MLLNILLLLGFIQLFIRWLKHHNLIQMREILMLLKGSEQLLGVGSKQDIMSLWPMAMSIGLWRDRAQGINYVFKFLDY